MRSERDSEPVLICPAAVATAKRYLSYVQGPVEGWACVDQRLLRHLIPENRLRVYDVRKVIELLADEGSGRKACKDPGIISYIPCYIRCPGIGECSCIGKQHKTVCRTQIR